MPSVPPAPALRRGLPPLRPSQTTVCCPLRQCPRRQRLEHPGRQPWHAPAVRCRAAGACYPTRGGGWRRQARVAREATSAYNRPLFHVERKYPPSTVDKVGRAGRHGGGTPCGRARADGNAASPPAPPYGAKTHIQPVGGILAWRLADGFPVQLLPRAPVPLPRRWGSARPPPLAQWIGVFLHGSWSGTCKTALCATFGGRRGGAAASAIRAGDRLA